MSIPRWSVRSSLWFSRSPSSTLPAPMYELVVVQCSPHGSCARLRVCQVDRSVSRLAKLKEQIKAPAPLWLQRSQLGVDVLWLWGHGLGKTPGEALGFPTPKTSTLGCEAAHGRRLFAVPLRWRARALRPLADGRVRVVHVASAYSGTCIRPHHIARHPQRLRFMPRGTNPSLHVCCPSLDELRCLS